MLFKYCLMAGIRTHAPDRHGTSDRMRYEISDRRKQGKEEKREKKIKKIKKKKQKKMEKENRRYLKIK